MMPWRRGARRRCLDLRLDGSRDDRRRRGWPRRQPALRPEARTRSSPRGRAGARRPGGPPRTPVADDAAALGAAPPAAGTGWMATPSPSFWLTAGAGADAAAGDGASGAASAAPPASPSDVGGRRSRRLVGLDGRGSGGGWCGARCGLARGAWQEAARAGQQQARETGRGEPRAQRRDEPEAGRGEGRQHAPPAGRAERGRLLGREPEVARADRGGQLGQRGRDRAQVAVELGALGARGDQVGRLVERGPCGVARGVGGDQLRVVGDVVGQVGHQPSSPRNSDIEPSRRSRSARRPRWIRDFTVPSETPVSSAISA